MLCSLPLAVAKGYYKIIVRFDVQPGTGEEKANDTTSELFTLSIAAASAKEPAAVTTVTRKMLSGTRDQIAILYAELTATERHAIICITPSPSSPPMTFIAVGYSPLEKM